MIERKPMKLPFYFFLVLLLGTVPAAADSTLSQFSFDSPEQEQAFRELAEELRCLVCQNESLAGSQAELAQDLREEVYGMLKEGKSKSDIVTFLVARYGDFVLYSPPLRPDTYLLWFGPFLLFAVGGFFLIRTLMRKQKTRDEDLTDEERSRLDAILTDKQD
jgi:cytochrome c-type biogenesis protein CcmH